MASTTKLDLAPSPGFCIKSSAQNSVSCTTSNAAENVHIPSGLKVFLNIAWDPNVPPPPDGSDAAIERAMAATSDIDPDQASQWWVPLVLSDPRSDTDKAGKPSVVFDAIFNTSLKSRALRSPEFKSFLVELAFQRIEAHHSLLLSRQIGTPNILSKGKLKPRSVLVPTSLIRAPPTSGSAVPPPLSSTSSKPLIEELPLPPPKSILKKAKASPPTPTPVPAPQTHTPSLTYSRTPSGHLRIALAVPHLTHTSLPQSTLDLEPRRLIFSSPPPSSYALDLDLELPDAALEALFRSSSASASGRDARDVLGLKGERPLDVEGARAEWRVGEGLLVVYA